MELFPLIREGKLEEVRALLQQRDKPDVNTRNERGQTPLYWACEHKSGAGIEMVELLIKHGADVNQPEDHGFTPLHLASHIGNASVVRLLLDNGAGIDMVNKSKSTALHLAARNGHEGVVAVLIQNGANVRAKDDKSKIPLAYANDPRISKLIQDAMLSETKLPRFRTMASVLSREELSVTSHSDDEGRRIGKRGKRSKKERRLGRSDLRHAQEDECNDHESEIKKLQSLVTILQDRLAREEKVSQTLQQEKLKEQQRVLCERCHLVRRDTVLVPCMHFAFCWECCGRMAMRCRKCGVSVEGMLRVNLG